MQQPFQLLSPHYIICNPHFPTLLKTFHHPQFGTLVFLSLPPHHCLWRFPLKASLVCLQPLELSKNQTVLVPYILPHGSCLYVLFYAPKRTTLKFTVNDKILTLNNTGILYTAVCQGV